MELIIIFFAQIPRAVLNIGPAFRRLVELMEEGRKAEYEYVLGLSEENRLLYFLTREYQTGRFMPWY